MKAKKQKSRFELRTRDGGRLTTATFTMFDMNWERGRIKALHYIRRQQQAWFHNANHIIDEVPTIHEL